MEPDAFMTWKRAPFFVEIQRSVYTTGKAFFSGCYIVFFGLLLLALLAFLFRPKHVQELCPAAAQRAKCESHIERRLFDALTARGYDVNAQVKCGPYRIDLALLAYNIAIECDGKEFHSSQKDKKRDRKKNAYLRKNGWIVLRFSGRQINSYIGDVLKKVSLSIK